MAITRYAGDRFAGLSTDTKPAALSGAIFNELDTLSTYFRTNNAWVLSTASGTAGTGAGTSGYSGYSGVGTSSGAYIFSQSIDYNIEKKYINFPGTLDTGARVVVYLKNNIYTDIIPHIVSGISTTGFWLLFGSIIPASGYTADVFASHSNSTGLASTVIISQGSEGGTGTSGYSGISGYSGYSGISGYSGYSGRSGYSGISGYSGYSGISGYSGYSGISGYSGRSGYSGYSGISGYSGPAGTGGGGTGTSGYSGYSGAGGVGGGITQITRTVSIYNIYGISASSGVIWRSPYSCGITGIWGYREGGEGATINARINKSNNHLISDLSLINTGIWYGSGIILNSGYNQGDTLEYLLTSTNGNVTGVVIQIELIK